MNLKTMNNRKGSAILWVILFTVILTILLGAIMTASFAYFNYTMTTVRRQQAYFTARSAMTTLLEKISESTSTADGVSDVIPDGGEITTVSNFSFPSSMGTAKAWIARGKVDDPKTSSLNTTEAQNYATILVEATYVDQTYSMKATVANQPIYFAGIAIDSLKFNNSASSLTLGNSTDLYYKKNTLLDLTNMEGGGTLTINGSLVTKGNVKVGGNSYIAGHTLGNDVLFSVKDGDYSYAKKIWSTSEYIISNKTLKYFEDATNSENTMTTMKTLRALVNRDIDYLWCNNRTAFKNYFGGFGLDDIIGSAIPSGAASDTLSDYEAENLQVKNKSYDALSVKYLKVQSNANILANLSKNILDIFYVGYESTNGSTTSDSVIPVTYILVPDSTKTVWSKLFSSTNTKEYPVTVRILFGSYPTKLSGIGQWIDDLKKNTTSIIDSILDRKNTPAYTIVYLGKGATLELGPDSLEKLSGKNVREQYSTQIKEGSCMIFPYTIYGEEGSTLILHDGVTVLGEINVPNLVIDGDVNVIYSNSNGSQVAKQKVDNYWTVCNFDG